MPPKTISYRKLRKRLLELGFTEVSIKGSHHKFMRFIDGLKATCIVPKHKEITHGTLKSIFKQGHITDEEFGKY